MEFYYVTQNWKYISNAWMFSPMDYVMNREEIDEQLYAQKMGLA